MIGLLVDEVNPLVSVMKVDKASLACQLGPTLRNLCEAPTESYGDIGGLEDQIMEMKEVGPLDLEIAGHIERVLLSGCGIAFDTSGAVRGVYKLLQQQHQIIEVRHGCQDVGIKPPKGVP